MTLQLYVRDSLSGLTRGNLSHDDGVSETLLVSQLGGYNKNPKLTAKARKAGQEANARKAAERAADLAPVISELQAAGKTSLRAIAEGLNERGIPTARGTGSWSAAQVMRVMARGPASSVPQRPFADLSAAA